jgi:hypothetical protein
MAVETAFQDKSRAIARVVPQEDNLGSFAVVLGFATDGLLRLAGEKVPAIKLEFLLFALSSYPHGLSNRREPDTAFLIDEQHPADQGNLSGRGLALVV